MIQQLRRGVEAVGEVDQLLLIKKRLKMTRNDSFGTLSLPH